MNPTVSLALATAAFVGTHFAMSHPLRPGLVARLGERGFAGAYTIVALATFAWIVFAYLAGADPAPLWMAALWWWPIASGLMLFASILLAGSLLGNPAFPGAGAKAKEIGAPKGVFAITRHPMNWSFILWALVHLSISGSPRNLIVAGGIFVLALFGSFGQDARKKRLLGEAWRGWEARTSFVPFGALLRGKVGARDAIPGAFALIGGLVLWALATSWHAPLVSPLGDLLSR